MVNNNIQCRWDDGRNYPAVIMNTGNSPADLEQELQTIIGQSKADLELLDDLFATRNIAF